MDYVPEPNSRISLRFPQCDLPVVVVRAFTPFTMQQVLLVQTLEDRAGVDLLSGHFAICKIYDPRFFSGQDRPWSYDAEAEAAKQRQSKPSSHFEPADWPDDDDPVGWEEWYYQQAELAFQSESVAYRLLAPLQGSRIPRCFGTGTLNLVEPRAISPRVLLLEYLPDAKSLADVDSALITPSLVTSLLETARAFGPLGVTHNDLNRGNILFSPGDSPSRAVVVDFGSSYVREEESDDEWATIVKQNNDSHWMEV